MAIRERLNNYFMDFEDTGFGGNAMEQNEALANILYPTAPTPTPVPVPTPVAAPAPVQEPDYYAQQFAPDIFAPAPTPAPAFTDPLEYLFSLDVERDPERLPIAPPVEIPVEFQPSFIETDPFRPPEQLPVAPPVEIPVEFQPSFIETDPFRPPEQLPVAPPVETPVEPPVDLLAALQPTPIERDPFGPPEEFPVEPPPELLAPPAAPQPAPVGKSAEAPAPKTNDATIEALIKQIQARSNTSQWSGGYGADQATKDMARILAETGITDIKQFGPITREVKKIVGYEDWGDPIYQTVTEQTFGNKETGQVVPNTYTERQTGNFFGGTYEGKGNTGYGVQFDAQGNPVFYTQGASSSDIGKIAPLLTLASFVPGLQPFAMAANAAIAAKQGNPLGVITNLAGMGGIAGISGMADVAKAAKFAGAVQSGDPLAMLFSGANMAGVNDIGGINLKDVAKTVGAVKAIESGDPLALLPYLSSIAPKDSGLSPSTEPSSTEPPLDPEEQAQLIENRLNTAISRSQTPIDEEDANTQRAISELESLYGPSSTTRSFTAEPQIEEADDFLKSIGINTLDKPSDSGLSNEGILNLINADNEMVITGKRDTVGRGMSEDILRNLENAGELPLPTPEKKLEELVIKGDRPKEVTVQQEPTGIDEFIKSLQPYIAPAPAPKLEELVMTGKRPMPSPDEDFPATPITGAEKLPELVVTGNQDKTKEHVFDPTFGGTLPLPEPVTATPPAATPKAPAKAPTTSARPSSSSSMDMMGLLALLYGQQAPAQQAPMQDPYAHIKLMEDLFGSTIDLTPTGEDTARRK